VSPCFVVFAEEFRGAGPKENSSLLEWGVEDQEQRSYLRRAWVIHLANDHTYTPYDQRYRPSCLPIQIVGNELHNLLHCPHSSPLSHPAILSRQGGSEGIMQV